MTGANAAAPDIFSFIPDEEQERKKRIWSPCWINYPVGNAGLEMLKNIYAHPDTHRPPCGIITGDTNSGKTALALKFMRMSNPFIGHDSESPIKPVILAQTPEAPKIGTFFSNILRSVGAPSRTTWSVERKREQVLDILPKLRTRMLIIDEIHHILDGSNLQRREFLNVLKFISNELRISLVAIGTKEALRAIQTDPQMGNRFEPFSIPRWKVNQDYANFLSRICTRGGHKDVNVITSKTFVSRIHTMSEGLTGETWKLMSRMLESADIAGRASLDMDMLDEISWVRPGERRKNA